MSASARGSSVSAVSPSWATAMPILAPMTRSFPSTVKGGGLTPSHRSGVVESLTARFAWQEDDHYGHEKKEVA